MPSTQKLGLPLANLVRHANGTYAMAWEIGSDLGMVLVFSFALVRPEFHCPVAAIRISRGQFDLDYTLVEAT